jgi:hypothetical protein
MNAGLKESAMEYTQIEIFNSYLFARNLLGLTNQLKNASFEMRVRIQGDNFYLINSESSAKLSLLRKAFPFGSWVMSSTYLELKPLSVFLTYKMNPPHFGTLENAANIALKEIIMYRPEVS